ncbi:unnamed protein product [Closterium sp. NIES-53]
MGSTTVNFATATAPFMDILERLALNVSSVPRSVCYGTWRLTLRQYESDEPMPHEPAMDEATDRARTRIIEGTARVTPAPVQIPAPVGVIVLPGTVRDDHESDETPSTPGIESDGDPLLDDQDQDNDDDDSGRGHGARQLRPWSLPALGFRPCPELVLELVAPSLGNGLLDPIARPRILYLYGPKGGEGKSTALQVLASQLPGCYRPLSRNYPGTASNLPEDEKAGLMDYRFTSHGDVVLKDGRVNATFWKEVCGGDLVSVSGGVGVLDLTVLPALDLPRPEIAFSDRDVFEFTCACLGTRLKWEQPPVIAECVLLTIFGKRAGIVTRAVRLAEPETFDQALVASYSIAMSGHMTLTKLITLAESMSPSAVFTQSQDAYRTPPASASKSVAIDPVVFESLGISSLQVTNAESVPQSPSAGNYICNNDNDPGHEHELACVYDISLASLKPCNAHPLCAQVTLRGHVAGGGAYVQVQKGGPPTLTAATVMAPTVQKDEPPVALILAEERDVTKLTSAAGPLEFTDMYVLWPDGGISPSLILQSVVVEYRTNIGQAKQYRSDRGDRTWSGSYMESYASLGIPAERYDWLMDCIRDCVPMPVDEPNATRNDGYAWVNAKLPDKSRLRLTMRVNQVTKQLASAVTTLNSIRANVIGIGTMTIKLRRIVNTTEIRSPPLNPDMLVYAFNLETASDLSMNTAPVLPPEPGLCPEVMEQLSVDHASVAVKCTNEFIESVKRIVGQHVDIAPLSYLALVPACLPLKHVVVAEGPYPSHKLPALASAFAYVAPDSSMTVSSQIMSQALCMSIGWEDLELCQNLVKRSHGLRNVGVVMVNCRMALDNSVCVNVALESLFSKWLMQMLIVSQAMNPDTVRLYTFGTPARKAVNAALQHMTSSQRTAVRCPVTGLRHLAWLSRICRPVDASAIVPLERCSYYDPLSTSNAPLQATRYHVNGARTLVLRQLSRWQLYKHSALGLMGNVDGLRPLAAWMRTTIVDLPTLARVLASLNCHKSSSDKAMASGNVNAPVAGSSAAGRDQGTAQVHGRGHRLPPAGEAGSYAMGLVQEAANTCRQLRDKSEAAIARLLVAIKHLEDDDKDAVEACVTELSNTNSNLYSLACAVTGFLYSIRGNRSAIEALQGPAGPILGPPLGDDEVRGTRPVMLAPVTLDTVSTLRLPGDQVQSSPAVSMSGVSGTDDAQPVPYALATDVPTGSEPVTPSMVQAQLKSLDLGKGKEPTSPAPVQEPAPLQVQDQSKAWDPRRVLLDLLQLYEDPGDEDQSKAATSVIVAIGSDVSRKGVKDFVRAIEQDEDNGIAREDLPGNIGPAVVLLLASWGVLV